ncbi:hypothetical protein COLO4_01713 [Corchorus olitorius]|uniref:Uncharacterized protein n=1 Tax=Corchorus olitorius TaxID=93759 RepID=A0A1R3L237_9ROSI|nr:hypothetical protein COLO4_01713 [Corchorus olitorius]
MTRYPQTIMHLSGGLRAEFPSNGNFNIWPIPGYGGFQINNMPEGQYFAEIEKFGLSWIGIDEIDQMDSLSIRIWTDFTYGYIPKISESRVADSVSAHCSGISYAYKLDGKEVQADLAEKISFHLRASSIRLRDISDSYGKQLEYACNKNMKSYHDFTNLEVDNLILSAHSFLMEICALRDYISLISSEFIFGIKRQQYMRKLADELRKNSINHNLKSIIVNATDDNSDDPWLYHLTEYRNYITHYAPLYHASQSQNMKILDLQHPYDHEMIAVTYRIPWNVKDKGENRRECDLLLRFHQLLIMMQKLCLETAFSTGIQPQYLNIGPHDIIGMEMI